MGRSCFRFFTGCIVRFSGFERGDRRPGLLHAFRSGEGPLIPASNHGTGGGRCAACGAESRCGVGLHALRGRARRTRNTGRGGVPDRLSRKTEIPRRGECLWPHFPQPGPDFRAIRRHWRRCCTAETKKGFRRKPFFCVVICRIRSKRMSARRAAPSASSARCGRRRACGIAGECRARA